MKHALIVILTISSLFAQAQISFRNDISLNKKPTVKRLAVVALAVAIGASVTNSYTRPNSFNRQNLVIDLNAIADPNKVYSYTEITQKIYTPNNMAYVPMAPIPYHLLMEPPKVRIPAYKARLYKRG